MRQNRLHSSLGHALREARRASGLTQAALAVAGGCSRPTVRQAEGGQGTLGVFEALATTLGLRIGGRSLPPGDTLGQQLAALRKRRGLALRTVARLADLSPTTVAALEADRGAHVTTALRIGEVLGAQLRLVPANAPPAYWTATAASSAHEAWTTPREVLEKLYRVIGDDFDLDPCSPVRSGPRAPVRARLRYVTEDDGLALAWRGVVFLNPPYGRALPRWIAKAHAEATVGRVFTIIGLVPARTDTRWWHSHVAGHADVWLLKGRLAFGDGANAAPFPSAIAVWNPVPEHRVRMALEFPDAWHVEAPPFGERLPPHYSN